MSRRANSALLPGARISAAVRCASASSACQVTPISMSDAARVTAVVWPIPESEAVTMARAGETSWPTTAAQRPSYISGTYPVASIAPSGSAAISSGRRASALLHLDIGILQHVGGGQHGEDASDRATTIGSNTPWWPPTGQAKTGRCRISRPCGSAVRGRGRYPRARPSPEQAAQAKNGSSALPGTQLLACFVFNQRHGQQFPVHRAVAGEGPAVGAVDKV